jgi:hypothetical protein
MGYRNLPKLRRWWRLFGKFRRQRIIVSTFFSRPNTISGPISVPSARTWSFSNQALIFDLPTLRYKDLHAQIARIRYCTTEVTKEIHVQMLFSQSFITQTSVGSRTPTQGTLGEKASTVLKPRSKANDSQHEWARLRHFCTRL